MMNCDQAFNVMTGGDDTADALDLHLENCPRCRQMYETLSPAIGLFDAERESASRENDSAVSAVQIAERVATRLGRSAPSPVRRPRRLALVTVGLVLGFGIAAAIPGLQQGLVQPGPSEAALISDCTWVNRDAAALDVQRSDAVVLSCVACHLSATE